MRVFSKDDLSVEFWKPLIGFEGICEASNLGRIKVLYREVLCKDGRTKHLKEKILTLGYYSNGYEQFSIRFDDARYTAIVHRLIAKTFIPNPENKLEVNHKNGIRDDNRVSNLEWVSRSENVVHSFKVLNRKPKNNTGSNNPRTSLTEDDVLGIKNRIKSGEAVLDVFKDFEGLLSLSAFRKICVNITWKHIVV